MTNSPVTKLLGGILVNLYYHEGCRHVGKTMVLLFLLHVVYVNKGRYETYERVHIALVDVCCKLFRLINILCDYASSRLKIQVGLDYKITNFSACDYVKTYIKTLACRIGHIWIPSLFTYYQDGLIDQMGGERIVTSNGSQNYFIYQGTKYNLE